MESKIFGVNNSIHNQFQTKQTFSLSLGSSFSYLSKSSGFGSINDIESDIEPITIETKNEANGSYESLMDSDFYGSDTDLTENFEASYQNQNFQCLNFFSGLQQQQFSNHHEYLTVFESNQLDSNQSTQLWQFLLEILADKKYTNLIRWTPLTLLALNEPDIKLTEHDNEFIINDTRELARLWGIRRNKPNMNHKKFNRILRHYYTKRNILKKPAGKRNTYFFQINIQPYMQFIKLEQEKINKRQIQNQSQSQTMQLF
jgi:hypothetical protein